MRDAVSAHHERCVQGCHEGCSPKSDESRVLNCGSRVSRAGNLSFFPGCSCSVLREGGVCPRSNWKTVSASSIQATELVLWFRWESFPPPKERWKRYLSMATLAKLTDPKRRPPLPREELCQEVRAGAVVRSFWCPSEQRGEGQPRVLQG